MISLNVVIWDESNVIDRCLQSAKDYVDEIVIMVDRSCRFTDRILKYADKIVVGDLTGTIVEHHRNELIGASNNEWILVMDPDEWLGPKLGPVLRNYCYDGMDGWYLPRYNIIYNEAYELMVGHDYPDWNLRLFRKHARYSGIIYEDSLSLSTVTQPLGLSNTNKIEDGTLFHDKTYEDFEEVKRTVELYRKWEEA